MAYSSTEVSKVLMYMGASALYPMAYTRLRNVLAASQSLADGGTLPDDSVEDIIRATLATLDALEVKISALTCGADVLNVDQVKLDPKQALMLLRSEGRRHVGTISRLLGCKAQGDHFSAADVLDDGQRYYDDWSPYGVE
jgi:hypothetical protein